MFITSRSWQSKYASGHISRITHIRPPAMHQVKPWKVLAHPHLRLGKCLVDGSGKRYMPSGSQWGMVHCLLGTVEACQYKRCSAVSLSTSVAAVFLYPLHATSIYFYIQSSKMLLELFFKLSEHVPSRRNSHPSLPRRCCSFRVDATKRWVESIVIGEKLCPFAAAVKEDPENSSFCTCCHQNL